MHGGPLGSRAELRLRAYRSDADQDADATAFGHPGQTMLEAMGPAIPFKRLGTASAV